MVIQEWCARKGLTRIHNWFPNSDQQIEELRNCKECTKMTKNPTKAFINLWNWSTRPLDIDYLL